MEGIIKFLVEGVLVPIIDLVVVPTTSLIPLLASSGLLLLVFAVLWAVFGVALVRDPARLSGAWTRLRGRPLAVQLAAWLLFLPVLAGLWVWRARWPLGARLAVIAGLAGWNLLVFIPQAA